MLLERFDSAPIWPLARRWLDLKPCFAWIPCATPIIDRDLVSGSRASLVSGAVLDYAGIRNPRSVVNGPRLRFENVQLNFSSGQLFVCIVLHTPFASTSRGSIVKFGTGTSGVGIAQGNGDDASSGTELLALRETILWVTNGPANLFNANYSRLAFFTINAEYIIAEDAFATSQTYSSAKSINTPTNDVWVNGRQDGNYTYAGSVHAVFVYKFTSLSNVNYGNFRDARKQEAFSHYLRGGRSVTYYDTMRQFRPRRSMFLAPAAGAAYTHPTLSAATLVAAGGNQYQPRVTYTFA